MAGYVEVVLFTGLLLEILSGRVGLSMEKVGYNAACSIVPKSVKSYPANVIELNTKKYSNDQHKPASVINTKKTSQNGEIPLIILNFKSDPTKPLFLPSVKSDYFNTPKKASPSSGSKKLEGLNNLTKLKLAHNHNAKPTLDKNESHASKIRRLRRYAYNSFLQPLKRTEATETTKERSYNYSKNILPSPARLVVKTTFVADEHDASMSSPFPNLRHATTYTSLVSAAYRLRTKNESETLNEETITTKSSTDLPKTTNPPTTSILSSVDAASTKIIGGTVFQPNDESETALTTPEISVTTKSEDIFYDDDGNTKSSLVNVDGSDGSTKRLYNKDTTSQITSKSGTTVEYIKDKKLPSPSLLDLSTDIENQVERFSSGASTAEYAPSEFTTALAVESETEKILHQSTTSDFINQSISDLFLHTTTSGIVLPINLNFSESSSSSGNYMALTTTESYAVVDNERELFKTEKWIEVTKKSEKLFEVTQAEFLEAIPTLSTFDVTEADEMLVTEKYSETLTSEATSTTDLAPTIIPLIEPTEKELGETSSDHFFTSTTTTMAQAVSSKPKTPPPEIYRASSVTNFPRIQDSTLLANSSLNFPGTNAFQTATSSSSTQHRTYYPSITDSSSVLIENMPTTTFTDDKLIESSNPVTSTTPQNTVEQPDASSPTIPSISFTQIEMNNNKPSVSTTSQLLLKNPSRAFSTYASLFSVFSSITTSGNQPESHFHSTFSNKLSRTEESTSELLLSSPIISLPLVTAGLTEPETLSLSTLPSFSTVADAHKSSSIPLVHDSLSTFQTNTPTSEQTSPSASLSPELISRSEVDKPAGDDPNATIGNGESISNTQFITTERVTIQNLPSSYISVEKKEYTSTTDTIESELSDDTIIPSLKTSSWTDAGSTDTIINASSETTKSSLDQLFTSSIPSSSSSSQLAHPSSISESFPPPSSSTIVLQTLSSQNDFLVAGSSPFPLFNSVLPLTTTEFNSETIPDTLITASLQIDLTTLSPNGITDEAENTLNDETSYEPFQRSTEVIDSTPLSGKPSMENSFGTMQPSLPTSEMSTYSLFSGATSVETPPISNSTTIQTSTISFVSSGLISEETLSSSTTLLTLASSDITMKPTDDDDNQKNKNGWTNPFDKHANTSTTADLTYTATESTNSFAFTGTIPSTSMENSVGPDTSGYFLTNLTDILLPSTTGRMTTLKEDATSPTTTTSRVNETLQTTMTATIPTVKIELEETTLTSPSSMEGFTEGTTELNYSTERNTEPIKAKEGTPSISSSTKRFESSTTTALGTTLEVANTEEETIEPASTLGTTSIIPLTSMTLSTMTLGSSYPLISTQFKGTTSKLPSSEETFSSEYPTMGKSNTQEKEIGSTTMGTTTEMNFITSSESQSKSSSNLFENKVTSTTMPMPTETPTMISTSTYQSTSTEIEEEVEDKVCDESVWLECDSVRLQCKCRAGMVYSEESNLCLSLEGQDCQYGGLGDRLCVKNSQCFPNRIGEVGKCKCKEGFLSTEQGICLPGLGSRCTKDFIEDLNTETDVRKNDSETGSDEKGNKTDSESILSDGSMCHPDLTCSSDKICMCKPGFSEGKPGSHRCNLDFGEKCSPGVGNNCNSFLYLNCSSTEGSCKCQNGDKMMYDIEQKLCVGIAGSKCTRKEDLDGRLLPCTKDSKCTSPNQNDGVEGICECDDGFENDWKGFCHTKNSQVFIHQQSWSLVMLMLIFFIL